jgi:Zn-dependent peptidase ImmA (M78 family)
VGVAPHHSGGSTGPSFDMRTGGSGEGYPQLVENQRWRPGWLEERLRSPPRRRSALEERDVLAFALEIGRGEVRGFSSWDPHAPLIAMNTSGVAPAPRCFTLAHELGHLVIRQDAACLDLAEETLAGIDSERWCEEFGAALLMPEQAVLAVTHLRGLPRRTADLGDARELTRSFRVSARAAALRLIDLNLVVEIPAP